MSRERRLVRWASDSIEAVLMIAIEMLRSVRHTGSASIAYSKMGCWGVDHGTGERWVSQESWSSGRQGTTMCRPLCPHPDR